MFIGIVTSQLELIYSFFAEQGDESSELKLDFTFDADLAKIANDKSDVEVKSVHQDPPPPITMPPSAGLHRGTAVVNANVTDIVLQSPAADDLNMKIASVKNVWERENHGLPSLVQYFEQRSETFFQLYFS